MRTSTRTTHLYAPSTELWDWQMRARCRNMGSDLFFSPERETRQARRYREKFATQICQECPVLVECRAHAQKVREPFGVWGGTTETDRQFGRTPESAGTRTATTTTRVGRRLTVSGRHPRPGRREDSEADTHSVATVQH
ncbi:WhiB family transcriptional regulator [Rhodococcus opacus]|nr:WhiB family transcriptional regulator [Rhodococcus opacus]RZL76579.1 MAG: WhiB family transcriptional regulator [Rhodococcus sp. (in: high G+C Gram-positive bacteria)]